MCVVRGFWQAISYSGASELMSYTWSQEGNALKVEFGRLCSICGVMDVIHYTGNQEGNVLYVESGR